MSFFDEIQAARKTLGLFEKASVSELKKRKKNFYLGGILTGFLIMK